LLAPAKAGGSGGVVADIAKLSVGREEYYIRELATDHEQYLSGHGESPGRWYGAGARSLGLQGEASPAGFQAMFEGRHPMTGELLGRPHGRNAVPAFDVVLRPTKSRPGGTLAHFGDDPNQLLADTDADRPVVAVRATVGQPGGSAQATWRRARRPSGPPGPGPCPGGWPSPSA
jgi:hypothetical protein